MYLKNLNMLITTQFKPSSTKLHLRQMIDNFFVTSTKLMSTLPVREVKNSKGEIFHTDLCNENFELFYKAQKVCREEEFPQFIQACRKGLPSVFRVVLTRPEAPAILSKLRKGYFGTDHLSYISWYPDKNTWKFNHTRWDLVEDPSLKGVHKILDNWRNTGNIYRQEQVSMVPVACLDIKSHHKVLDMCAAPGSKTGQVLEAMHMNSEEGTIPSGIVVANEPDINRCKVLTGNMKLFSSPCLLVTSHRGESFPDILDKDGQPILYDRIVCDVPCSGDGTIRKNPNVWLGWHPGRGNQRFFLQLNIARRGIQLLKEGGLIVYSTCSMNQIENECVVAQLIEESDGGLELVDMRESLKGIRYEPGLDNWCVFDSNMNQYHNYEQVPSHLRPQICREMFPTEQTKHHHLDRTLRFLPHQNDDGGFYVAVIRKLKHTNLKMKERSRKQSIQKGLPILQALGRKQPVSGVQ